MRISKGQRFMYREYYKDEVREREVVVAEATPHVVKLDFADERGGGLVYPRHLFIRDTHPILVRQLEVVYEWDGPAHMRQVEDTDEEVL